jgi:hypothetical protein
LINVCLGCAISPVRFGGRHLDQLMMAGDQSGEFAGGGVGQWSRLRPHHLGEVRQHFHIDPVNPRLARANRLPVLEPNSRAGLLAEIDRFCLHIAFRSPEGHDAKGAENDWLRAGKGAMCVSIF